jgi:hypothetical protein
MQPEGFSLGAFLRSLLTDSHSPHVCSTREYTPSLSHSPPTASPPSQGLDNRPDQELSELRIWRWNLFGRKPLPNKLSHLGEFLTGLRTCLFNYNHLPHLERVLHIGLTTCFLNSIPAQGGQKQGSTRNKRQQQATLSPGTAWP